MEKKILNLRVDHFWYKVFTKGDGSGGCFVVLPKMVNCALALCHSNADVERSLSTSKKVVTKHNVSMKKETITGLQSVKVALEEFGGVEKVPITLDTVKTAEYPHHLYNEHLREEQAKERQKDSKMKPRKGSWRK